MKPPKLLLILWCCFTLVTALAQTPKSIEADLYSSFDKIKHAFDNNNIRSYDSLQIANDLFRQRLNYYSIKYPFTFDLAFKKWTANGPNVITSSDGLMKIFSWDTYLGGTMHQYYNLLQYKSGNKIITSYLIDTADVNDNNSYYGYNGSYYKKIFVLKANKQTHYLATATNINDSFHQSESLRIYTINNGKLEDSALPIKTEDGIVNGLYIDFKWDKGSGSPLIVYNAKTQTIKVSVVGNNEIVLINKYTIYKFDGKCFKQKSR